VQEVPDLQTANTFITGSYDKYSQCIINFELLQTVSGVVGQLADPVTSTLTGVAASLPAQVLSATSLALGIGLLAYGYKLLRPLNFIAGAYLGGTATMLLLSIFAPLLTNCLIIVPAATAVGLGLGITCALKRTSVIVVLALVVGEIIGDIFYKTFLAAVAPEYVAFGCIGFFAVLSAVLAGHLGDFAWKLGSAFLGASLVVNNFIKLLIVPYVPDGVKFEAFLAFQPDVTQAVVRASEYQSALFGSPFVYGPALILLVLTAAGTKLQQSLLSASQKVENERLIMK